MRPTQVYMYSHEILAMAHAYAVAPNALKMISYLVPNH